MGDCRIYELQAWLDPGSEALRSLPLSSSTSWLLCAAAVTGRLPPSVLQNSVCILHLRRILIQMLSFHPQNFTCPYVL